MRFVNPLPFVRDMQIARDFYRDVVGLYVLQDSGDFVQFADGFALHEGRSLLMATLGHDVGSDHPFGRDNIVFYFETDDLEAAFGRISPFALILHGIVKQHWGQRVFRFRDPDGHLVEIGEPQRVQT